MGSAWRRTPELTQRVVELTTQEMPTPMIAGMLGVSERTVTRHRRRAGICPRPLSRFTPDEIRVAESLLDDGASYGEVARTLGRDKSVVRQRFIGRSSWPKGSGGQLSRMFAALDEVRA